MERPYIYQDREGLNEPVSGGFVPLGDNSVGFEIAYYDALRPLVIDPAIAYATYLGGSGQESGAGIAVYNSGNAYDEPFFFIPVFLRTVGKTPCFIRTTCGTG